MSQPRFGGKSARTLDLDIEVRPLSWYGGDWVTKEITAIAARFLDEDKTRVWLLGENDPVAMLVGFRLVYDEADIVTGHYIRGFDLPILNGAMTEYELPPLDEKWSVDTKLDLIKRQGLSNSQENIAAMLGLDHPKVQMNQAKWREANRLTPEGIALTRERVVGDVAQHIEMLDVLRKRGLVGPGKLWTPKSHKTSGYTP